MRAWIPGVPKNTSRLLSCSITRYLGSFSLVVYHTELFTGTVDSSIIAQ